MTTIPDAKKHWNECYKDLVQLKAVFENRADAYRDVEFYKTALEGVCNAVRDKREEDRSEAKALRRMLRDVLNYLSREPSIEGEIRGALLELEAYLERRSKP